jgi:hypothetical protein
MGGAEIDCERRGHEDDSFLKIQNDACARSMLCGGVLKKLKYLPKERDKNALLIPAPNDTPASLLR